MYSASRIDISSMQEITLTGRVSPDGHLRLDIPTQLPEGTVSIIVVIDGVDESAVLNNNLPLSRVPVLQVILTARPLQVNEPNVYPLRGSVLRYDDPTDPVAEDAWTALQ